MYLVKHKTTEKLFAMKVMQKKKLREEGIREIVKNEKEVLQKLDCPFAAKFYYSFQTDTKLYFVLEYVEGGDFTKVFFAKGRLKEDWVRFYSAEIILALEYLHKNNIIYRDLKSRNIMLDGDGHVKLIDFGLAKVLERDKAYTVCGTPNYIAPEILTGNSYSKAVDWWSLGIVIYEMLAGNPPFYGENEQRIMQDIINSEVHMKPYFSAEAKDLLKKLLRKNPAERLGVMKEGVAGLKKHPFYASIDWNKLWQKALAAPFNSHSQKDDSTETMENSLHQRGLDSPYHPKQSYFDSYENFTYSRSPRAELTAKSPPMYDENGMSPKKFEF